MLQLTACPVQLGTPFGTAAMPEVRAADVVSVDDAGLPVCLWPLECSQGLMCGASSSSVASPFCHRRMASHSSLTRFVHQNITSLIHPRGSQLEKGADYRSGQVHSNKTQNPFTAVGDKCSITLVKGIPCQRLRTAFCLLLAKLDVRAARNSKSDD